MGVEKEIILERWAREATFRERMYEPVLNYLMVEKVLEKHVGSPPFSDEEIEVTPSKWRDGNAILLGNIPGLDAGKPSLFARLFQAQDGKKMFFSRILNGT